VSFLDRDQYRIVTKGISLLKNYPLGNTGRKRRNRIRLRMAFVISIMAMAGYWYYRHHRFHFVYFPSFGISIPVNYHIHGIDISRYQGKINWKQVKAMDIDSVHIWFVFIKATEGISRQDDRFRENWLEAGKAGLIRGAYHYFYSTRDPVLQAKNFESEVRLKPGDLPPVLDIEISNDQPDSIIQNSALAWLKEIRAHYGVNPIIYTNIRFYNRHLGEQFDRFPLWVSHFYLDQLPETGRDWEFWQHSDSGLVNGISTRVDFNVFNGDSAALRKLCVP